MQIAPVASTAPIPGTYWQWQGQAGHCPHDEVPEQVNALIRSWVLANSSIMK